MRKSKYNITSKIKDSDAYYIINLLSGNADILDEKNFNAYSNEDISALPELVTKGYLVDEQTEEKIYRQKYLEFIENTENDEIQLFFVPNYSCNFACSYCYQDEYTAPKSGLSESIIDHFFAYITTTFAGRKKYITLFGGEPLLSSPAQKKLIEYFFNKARDHSLDIAIVTNGYAIEEYIELLKIPTIREVQVTLDGTKEIHDKRRYLKDGSGSFEQITKGIDLLLGNNITVNLRVVVDKENFSNLSNLAQYAIERGWTKKSRFKTQLGRNYELHHCQENSKRLFTRIELYESLYHYVKDNPHILDFHKPAFSISKFLFEEGELPEPLFDACPGTKTEWAFDYTGRIFSCTATVGKQDEVLGTFYPEVFLDQDAVEQWESRDLLAIGECMNCAVQLACGGGCGSLAKNIHGSVNSPDCRPVKELLSLGIGFYQSL